VSTGRGPLALLGGRPFTEGCTFDAGLLEAAGGGEVLVLPTAAAYEHPQRLVDAASEWFDGLGGTTRGLDVLARADALEEANAQAVRRARFIYLVGDNPMHLRATLKGTPVFDALSEAWADGAVLAAVAGSARVLCDPTVDPRGGAFSVGLGLVTGMAVIPHHDHWSPDKARRTLELAPDDLPVAAVDDATALIRDPAGAWRAEGAGNVAVFRAQAPVDLDALPIDV
jgi:cyanophycinase